MRRCLRRDFATDFSLSPTQTEPEARKKYGDDQIKIYTANFTSLYYSMMEPDEKEPTAYKMIVAGPEEKVVGLHLLGIGSDEMLQGFAVAIKMGGEWPVIGRSASNALLFCMLSACQDTLRT